MNSIVSAAAVASATAIPSQSIASDHVEVPAVSFPGPAAAPKKPDPIFAAIAAHRVAYQRYLDASAAFAEAEEEECNHGIDRPSAQIQIGEHEETETIMNKDGAGGGTILFFKTGRMTPTYASNMGDILRSVPDHLEDDRRQAWIEDCTKRLDAEKDRIKALWMETKLGGLEAAASDAYNKARDCLWDDLIWTKPTTLEGLVSLFACCREYGGIGQLMTDQEWSDVLEWTMESALCELVGLPQPPMSDIVEELWNDVEETAEA